MEAIDWDVYAKSYEDTQHLVGRPDLAQKHYDLIGRDQGRDHGFNPLLVFCLYDDVQTLDDARKAVLRDPARYPIRSRLALKQAVASFPTLLGILPQASDYLLEPAVDAFLFQLQLEQRKQGVGPVLDALVQEVTNELLADLSVERGSVLGALPKSEVLASDYSGTAVTQRDSVIRIAQKSPYVVRIESLIPVLQGEAFLVLGYGFDPEQQWIGLELKTGTKAYNVFPILKRFVWHNKVQVLQEGGVPGEFLEPDVGFALLVKTDHLDGIPQSLSSSFRDAQVVDVKPPVHSLSDIDPTIIPILWSIFQSDLFDFAGGRLELIDSVFLDKRTPLQARKSSFRMGLDHVFKVQRNLLISGYLFDGQQALKALYLKLSSGRFVRLDIDLVRTPRADLADDALANGLSPQTIGFCAFSHDVFVDDQSELELIALLDSGEWVCDNTKAEVADPVLIRSFLLERWDLNQFEHSKAMLERVIEPVFPLLGEVRRAQVRAIAPTLSRFGEVPKQPKVSVVVYYSGSEEELKYLLVSLKQESIHISLEVLVIAEAYLAQKLQRALKFQADVLGLSLLLISHQGGQEYGQAINFAAEHCTGVYLCLIDASVVPARNSWLTEMVKLFDRATSTGLVSARLLNVHGMIHSLGMSFVPETTPVSLWAGDFPHRGLPLSTVNLPEYYEMPAVTMECVVLERRLFQGVAGFDTSLAGGRLEAVDLCLRIWQAEKRILVCSHADMVKVSTSHNLEADAQDQAQKELLAYRRLHHNRWSSFIDQHFRGWQVGVSQADQFIELKNTMRDVLGGGL